jgi:hypothetical protein
LLEKDEIKIIQKGRSSESNENNNEKMKIAKVYS